MRIASFGHAVFAITMIALGVMGFVKADFTVVWQPVAKNVPAREVLVYLCAFVSAGCGVGLLCRRASTAAARVLLAYLLLWMLVFRVPPLFHSLSVDIYWSACKAAVLVAAAWILYVWFAAEWDKRRLPFATGDSGLRIARTLYGLAMIPFGIAHFQYVQNTASLVPAWLPAHVAFAYLTGAAFIIAGIAIVAGVYARLAAALSALQMGMFLLLVWLPVALTRPMNSFQWGETVISWVLAVAGWVVADSYRETPWSAAR